MIRTKLKFLLVICIVIAILAVFISWRGYHTLTQLKNEHTAIEQLYIDSENLKTLTLELLYGNKMDYRFEQWKALYQSIGNNLKDSKIIWITTKSHLVIIYNNINSSIDLYQKNLALCRNNLNLSLPIPTSYCTNYMGRLRTQLKLIVKEFEVEMWKINQQISSNIENETQSLGLMLLSLSFLLSLFIIAAVLPIIQRLATGLNALLHACKQYTLANYSYKITVSQQDEMGELATALNNMSEQIDLFRNQSPLATIEWDRNFQVNNLNTVAVELFGYKIEEALQQKFYQKISSKSAGLDVKKIWQDQFNQSVSQKYITNNITKNGQHLVCEWHNVAMTDIHGQTIGVISVILDITERQRMELQIQKQKQEQTEILNSMVDAVISIDENDKVLTFNTTAEKMFGYCESEIKDRNVKCLMPEVFQHDSYLKRYTTTGKANIIALSGREVEGQRKNNQCFPMRLFIAELPIDDGKRRFIISCFDLTQRKKTEAQIKRTVELDKANAELQIVNKELEAFTYSVSHDLRRPLRAISGFSQILLEDYSEKFSAKEKELFDYIIEGGKEMSQLIDSLLRLSRITRRAIHNEQVNLSQIAENKKRQLLDESPSREVNFIIEPDVMIEADPQLMKALLDNLLDNAWKFTSKKALSTIEFGIILDQDVPIYFIRDNGVGFDMEYVEKLFLPFQRLHRRDEFEGTGIGLSTAERIVSRHAGHIWAKGVIDQGATFYFKINVKKIL